ncbi:AMP-binding protein [Paeniglutamicibacter psychrophenolicus]|uniref:2-aminobenzoate-CoA ligase n=1 Tax=Paeniglutamicibacter psychrophenolicus TaxID=257454 RepID=A0ABS4WD42_9MICC|nr:AMP-binding protein [Paeniglutamicibacter psychrophenolicus]MBP2373524.1 2-aminobenzoate-CoA ligase [Paeniglutamicibacter psychrophenolicus]
MELSLSSHQDTFTRDHLPPHELWPTLEFTLPELQYPERLNAATVLIDDAVAKFGAESPALLAPDGTVQSYGELLTRSNQVAQVLVEDFGIVPGNRVMLRAPNNAWLVACWLGVLKAGAVVVTTMPALRAPEIAKLAQLTKPALMLCDHRFLDDARDAAGSSYPVVAVGSQDPADLVALSGSRSGEFANVDTAADDVALLGPTSGTTGVPKITMHFHRDILANADTFARHILAPTPDDVFAGSPPLAFTFGLGGLVVFPLRFGASTLLTERTTPVELAQFSHDAGATILFTAPTAYRAILKEGKAELLRPLRIAVSAGEHLPAATWEAVKDATGLELIDGIGSTELLHVFISAAGADIRPGTTGTAVPGYRATILDLDGNELGPDEVGRLAVIGPTGCRYLDDERQHAYVSNGWNVTGDTFVRDADGYFTYQARSDNMIISSGYNIGGPEVEEAIIQHPDVMETAVVARPDEHRGSVVCAFVVLVDGVTGSPEKAKELQDFVKTVIAPYKYPREVRFVDELPRNPSGKLQHFKLREALAQSPAS